MNRGEVWWFELPDVGRRPGLILTRQAAIPILTSLLIVPATRTIRGIPTELELGPADGMPATCVLSFDNVLTVPKSLLTRRITVLTPGRLDHLCRTLRIATGC